MKKLVILATAIFALLIGTNAIFAKPPVQKRNDPAGRRVNHIPRINGHYNRRGVYIFKTTKIVSKRNGKYLNTYRHKIFPNGRKQTVLLSSVKMRKRQYGGHGGKTSIYRTRTIYRGWKAYRVTYKITTYPNGRVTRKIVNSRRIYGR